jgi:hypothetical protein
MPILNTTAEAIRALLSLVPHARRLIQLASDNKPPTIRGSGAVTVRTNGDQVVIHVDPPPPPPPGRSVAIRCRISDFDSFATNQWNYTLEPVIADATRPEGIYSQVGALLQGRNTWEFLSSAGYVSGSVTGLRAIPIGAVVTCFGPVVCSDGKQRLIFSERNEPIC